MLSRRDFMQSTAAYGALAATGLLNARPAGAATTWVAPANIPNDGSANASAMLTWWLAVAGQPGDTFQLRRGPGYAPGVYWVPQGIKITKPMTLDLNGCWLQTGLTLGFDDPNLAESKTLYPPLWTDRQEDLDWPAKRCVLVIASSNVKLTSSLVNARIQGSARTVHYRGSPTGPVGRAHPTGCGFHNQAFGDGQHGIRIGGNPGNYSDTHSYSDIEIDLTNTGVEFVHGDGIDVNDNHHRIWVHGRKLGPSYLGGVPGTFDDQHLAAPLAGGTIQQNAGTQWVADDPRSADRWVPDTLPLPGIHHTGRQGIATSFRNYDTLIENLSMWRIRRSCIDWETESSRAEVIGCVIRNAEFGVRTFNLLAASGPSGPVNDLLMEDVVSYELPLIDVDQPGALDRGRYRNWTLRNVSCPTGVKLRVGAVFTLPRIDGLNVLSCHALIKGEARGVLTDTGSVYPSANRPSTGVVIDPAESVQFPFTP